MTEDGQSPPAGRNRRRRRRGRGRGGASDANPPSNSEGEGKQPTAGESRPQRSTERGGERREPGSSTRSRGGRRRQRGGDERGERKARSSNPAERREQRKPVGPAARRARRARKPLPQIQLGADDGDDAAERTPAKFKHPPRSRSSQRPTRWASPMKTHGSRKARSPAKRPHKRTMIRPNFRPNGNSSAIPMEKMSLP